MVFEGVLAAVINRFLGPYVKNLDASQLNVGIWSGDVCLERLEIKENALAQFDVPLRVFKGYLGKLRLKVPWSNLYSAPVVVEVDGVYIVAGPLSAVPYNPEKELKEEKEEKQRKLHEIDEARKNALETEASQQQDPGFVEKLVTQIIRNVQITVKNVHIRYEDFVTRPNHPFSFGVSLDSLLLQSTDSEWTTYHHNKKSDSVSSLLYKVAKLNCLGLYWNTDEKLIGTNLPPQWMDILVHDIARPNAPLPTGVDYVLLPVSGLAKLQVSTRPGQDMNIPQILLNLVVHEVAVEFDKQQYHDVMSLVENIDRMRASKKYRKYRPVVALRGNTRAWWLYAYSVVLLDVKRRLNMWSWNHIKKHRSLCREYTQLYTEKLLLEPKPPPYLIAKIQDYEDKLDVFNITVCKQLAENEARKKQQLKSAESERGGWMIWASSWLGGSEKGQQDQQQPKIPTKEELEKERRKLYEAIGYSEKGKAAGYSKEYVAHRAECVLHKLSLKLKDGAKNIGHLVTESVSITFLNRPSSHNIRVEAVLKSLLFTGSQSKEKDSDIPDVLTSKLKQQEEKRNGPLLLIAFELNPLNSKFDQCVKSRLQPIRLFYDAYTVDNIISFFLLPKEIQMNKMSSIAANTLEELKTQSRAGLQHVISERRLLDLDVELSSPVVVIPEGGVRTESGRGKLLVLNCGSLFVTSCIQDHVPDVQEATLEELERAFYDKFVLTLSKTSIALTDEKWLSSASTDSHSSSSYILNPLKLTLTIEKSLLPNDTRLPGLKVTGDLPGLLLCVSDQKIKELICLMQSIPLPPPSLANRDNIEIATQVYTGLPEPVAMATTAIVASVSSTVVPPLRTFREEDHELEEDEEADSDEFVTASEGEDDEEEKKPLVPTATYSNDKGVVSTTKMALKFKINEMCVTWLTEKNKTDEGKKEGKRLQMMVTGVELTIQMRSWDILVKTTVKDFTILDYFYLSYENPTKMLSSSSISEHHMPLLEVTFAMVDRSAPHYQSTELPTYQSVSVHVALTILQLHSNSLSDLMKMSRDILSVVKFTDPPQPPPDHTSLSLSPEHVDSSLAVVGERLFYLMVHCGGMQLCLHDGDGVVAGIDVTNLSTSLQLFQDVTTISASVGSVSITNLEPGAVHTKILTPVDPSKCMIASDISLYKRAPMQEKTDQKEKDEKEGSGKDLSAVNVSVDATVQRLRGVVLGHLIHRLMRYGQQLKNSLDEEMLASARVAASKTAVKTAETLKEHSSSLIKLSVVLHAPEIVVPLSSTSCSAVIADLGKLELNNQFCWANQIYSQSVHDSTELCGAVVDVMTVKLSDVQLYRLQSLPEDGSLMSCDRHMIIEPLQCCATLRRNLTSWIKSVPAIDVDVKLRTIQICVGVDDIEDVASVLRGNLIEVLPISNSDNASQTGVPEQVSPPGESLQVDVKSEQAEDEIKTESDFIQIKFVAQLESINMQLHGIVGHQTELSTSKSRFSTMKDPSTKVALLSLTQLEVKCDVHSSSAVKAEMSVKNCGVTDCRPGKTSRRMIEGLQTEDAKSLVKATYSGSNNNHTVSMKLNYPQILVDVNFLLAISELASSYSKPFSSSQQLVSGADNMTIKSDEQSNVGGIEDNRSSSSGSSVKVTMRVSQPRVVLLEDTEKSEAAAVMVLQMDFDMSFNGGSEHQQLYAGVNSLNIVSTTYSDLTATAAGQPVLGQMVLAPCDISITLTGAPGISGGSEIAVDMGVVVFTVSTATVRLILNVLKPLQQDQAGSDLAGETAPADLWVPTDNSSLWYLQQQDTQIATLQLREATRSSIATTDTPAKNESLRVKIEMLQVLIEKEDDLMGQLSPAISIILGSQKTTAIELFVTEWSGKLSATATITLTASYFNSHNDIWEPLIEPLVTEDNTVIYYPWCVEMKVQRPLLDHATLPQSMGDLSTLPPEFIVLATSSIPLQLTLSKTSVALIMALLKDYQKITESTDNESEESLGTTVKVVNKLGEDHPVTIQLLDNVQLLSHKKEATITHGNEVVLHQVLTDEEEEESEHGMKRLIGELLPQKEARERMIRLRVTVKGFAPVVLSFRSSGRRYYPLKHQSSDDHYAMVVSTEKLSPIDPTVITLTSPVELYNHFSSPIEVLWSSEKQIVRHSLKSVQLLAQNETGSLPLSKSCSGYIFFRPQMNKDGSSSSKGVHLKTLYKTRDVRCGSVFVHVRPEEQHFLNKLSFSLDTLPHHILHLSHPLLFHNLLPYNVSITSPCVDTVLPGQQLYISKYDPTDSLNIKAKILQNDVEFTGDVVVTEEMEETSTFKFISSSSSHKEMLLSVRKELRSTWHLSLYSQYWLVNKTGLKLQYSTQDFWGGAENEMTHPPDKALLLFPYKKARVRVLCKAGQYSEWSDSFSLDTVGSEGVLSCRGNDQILQMGIEVKLSKLNLTKIITVTPFYMLHNLTQDSVSILEYNHALKDEIIVKPGELVPFWPQSASNLMMVAIYDVGLNSGHSSGRSSAPFKYSVNRSLLLKLPGKVPGVFVEVQVTGSANLISFQPYYPGAAPVRLVNDCSFDIAFGQSPLSSEGEVVATLTHTLKSGMSRLYTWDYPQNVQELFYQVVSSESKGGTLKLKDSNGEFTIPSEYIGITGISPASVRKKAVDGEDDVEVSGLEQDSKKKEMTEEMVEVSEGEAEDQTDGGWKAGQKMKKRLTSVKKKMAGVQRSLHLWKKKKKTGDPSKGYWVSFTDNLQRVVLFTPFKEVAERAIKGSEPARTNIDVSLSLRTVGLSLVNDEKGQEVAYISLPQSEVIWEMAKHKIWKPVEGLISDVLERMYQEKKWKKHEIGKSDWIADFTDPDNFFLLHKEGEKRSLRRSHFEGLFMRAALSKNQTILELRISKLQIDSHLPFARNPTIFYCYPPPPSVASSVAPKPFVSGTLIVSHTDQRNSREVEYLKVLVQEMGFTLDLGFLVNVANLFGSVADKLPEEQLMLQDQHYIQLSLKDAEVTEVSRATARTFFKFIHLSPIVIHVSFSLEMSGPEKQEAHLFADTNIILKSMLDIIYSFVGFIGRAKDTELRLGYFEIQERSLTDTQLLIQIRKHYQQQALIQLYKVVFGLEVLGNPVGFLSGLKDGTIGLFYQPIQGAVAGPEEFMEGLALGTHQFVEGTIGGIAGVGARLTGVLGDAVAKLTFDQEFQGERQQGDASFGKSLGGFGKGILEGVTGVVAQPVKGAKKEGVLGLLKGTGKGVLGLVLRPTGGLIDLTSATLAAVQKTTKVGDFELTQVRTARFIGLDRIIYPYSPAMSAGYAVFMEFDSGKLYLSDLYVGNVGLSKDPLVNLLVTDSRVMILKYNNFFHKWEVETAYLFKDFYKPVYSSEGKLKIPVLEGTAFMGFGSKKKQEVVKDIDVGSVKVAQRAERIINRGYLQFKNEQSLTFQ